MGEMADAPVMLAVRAMAALPKTYELNQKAGGVLGTIAVDNRQDVSAYYNVGGPGWHSDPFQRAGVCVRAVCSQREYIGDGDGQVR